MANVRCREKHSESLIQNARRRINSHIYVARIEPINYRNTAVICGTKGCPNPGLVHLDEQEWLSYQQGERIFGPFETQSSKFRISENAEIIEIHDGKPSFRSWTGN